MGNRVRPRRGASDVNPYETNISSGPRAGPALNTRDSRAVAFTPNQARDTISQVCYLSSTAAPVIDPSACLVPSTSTRAPFASVAQVTPENVVVAEVVTLVARLATGPTLNVAVGQLAAPENSKTNPSTSSGPASASTFLARIDPSDCLIPSTSTRALFASAAQVTSSNTVAADVVTFVMPIMNVTTGQVAVETDLRWCPRPRLR